MWNPLPGHQPEAAGKAAGFENLSKYRVRYQFSPGRMNTLDKGDEQNGNTRETRRESG